jgi:putative FmdB family regulatory protein
MPTYDFICNDCKKRFDAFVAFSEYENKAVHCIHCQSVNVRRRMVKLQIAKADESRTKSTADDDIEDESARPITDNRTVQRELNVKFLPVLVGIFGILYMLTGFRGWLVFFFGLLGLWLLAVLWVYILEHNLSIERKIQLTWATVGDLVPEELKITNKSRLPALWVEIVDETDSLDTPPIRLVSDVESNASRRRQSVHLFNQRGFYTLGPTRLRTGDPFGVYTLTLRDLHSSSVLVMPPQLSLTQLKLTTGGWSGDRHRRRGIIEREFSEIGVRNYLPGDSLRRIHWHASAHRDSLMVRQLEAATSDDWMIFVDLDAAVQLGVGKDSTLELAIVLAASLAMHGWKERRRVGLALVGPELVWLEPRSDPAQPWRIQRALAMAKAGRRSLGELISLASPRQTATSIVITPTTDPAWVAASKSRYGGNRVMALLVDPTEFGNNAGQGVLVSALARSGISLARMPRSLLEEAYPFLAQGDREPVISTEAGTRYPQHKKELWQSMS